MNFDDDIPDSKTFIIHDNSSEMAKFIPEKYVEPLVIIARVQGFDGIDDYIIHLIKDELEMCADTRNDLDDAFQKYMHDMLLLGDEKDVPNTRRASNLHNLRDHSTKTTTTKTKKAEEAVEDKETNDDDTDDDGTTTEEDAVEETTKEEDEEEGEEDSK